MATTTSANAADPGQAANLSFSGPVHSNLTVAALFEHAVRRNEGIIANGGPFCAITTPHTGRSPRDKFVVKDDVTRERVWWGPVNQPLDPDRFQRLYTDTVACLQDRELFTQDLYAGADPNHRLRVRFITTNAWQAMFVRNMFIRPPTEDVATFSPDFTVFHAPELQADPRVHGTQTTTFVVLDFSHNLAVIGGTQYAGEMKKSMFTVMNYVLPHRDVLPMHCSANVGQNGETALFFGLSGTGKTTLSADPERALIGDDEHGWSDDGIFNFEGGCYAKVIRLSAEGEPEIYETTRRFGTILENVVVDPTTRVIDLDDDSITENTRGSYPIDFIPNHVPEGKAGHPRHVVFLTADAFGVIPPIARLTREQAMYHFLSGYTAKVAGTERGVTEPQATFSACFGAPFLPLHPWRYAEMLGRKMEQHEVDVWLINTGWTGGTYGTGSRMKLAYTRAMIRSALSGALNDVATSAEPVFGLAVPAEVWGVPSEVLDARSTWDDATEYDTQAAKLAAMFTENFVKYSDRVSQAVRDAGPRT